MNIGSQYSYSSSDQSEFLVIVSRLVDEPREKDSHTTDKERVSLPHLMSFYPFYSLSTVTKRSRIKNVEIFIVKIILLNMFNTYSNNIIIVTVNYAVIIITCNTHLQLIPYKITELT